MERWSIAESAKIYNLDNWGADLFSINKKGNVCVHPSPTSKHSIDLRALMDDLIKRKIKPPILLRFMDILQGRIASINRVFKNAIQENEYPAKYQTFYPIKVNQQRQVVEAIASFGKRYNIGIEVGSKPELVAGISISTGNGLPIICNGYKDNEYIETVLYATRIGYDITLVVEKLFELDKIIELSKKTGIRPKLGIRVKLSSKGTGKWATSGGEDAKFGLRMSEIIAAIGTLEKHELLDTVKLLHFHIGSQITKIDKIKTALIEGTRIYTEMKKLGVGSSMWISVEDWGSTTTAPSRATSPASITPSRNMPTTSSTRSRTSATMPVWNAPISSRNRGGPPLPITRFWSPTC